MSRTHVTYLVAAVCGVLGLGAFIGLILVPAVSAYNTVWQRAVAMALSFYVLAAMIGVGVLGAVGVYELWINYG